MPSDLKNAAQAQSALASLVFRLTRLVRAETPYFPIESEAVIQGSTGWTSFQNVKRNAVSLGELGLLEIDTDLVGLEIDQRKIEVQGADRLMAIGQLTAAYTEQGELRITGSASAVWRNRARLNLTLWERLSEAWQLALLGAVFAAVTFVVQRIWVSMRGHWDDDVASWL